MIAGTANRWQQVHAVKKLFSKLAPLRHESSMNFDRDNLSSFLGELDSAFGFGLSVPDLLAFADSVDSEGATVVGIKTPTGAGRMRFGVFWDDEEAVDLAFFFSTEALAERVDDFMIEWAESRGM